jgi:chemotaxis family two-component system sensor kinase Cph1
MSRAVLRHVSVMYSSYLKNMQVHSTMVMPLMKAGQLWGLISCMHHGSPLHVPCETRMGLELLAIMVSLSMAEKDDLDTMAYRHRMKEAIECLISQMAQEPVYHRGLSGGAVNLGGWLDAAGAALVTGSGIVLFGQTPDEQAVAHLASWLSGQDDRVLVFATDQLSQVYPAAAGLEDTSAGLLAARLMRGRPECVMWFRPEAVGTIDWAGDPNKPVQVDVVDGRARLTPRGSFDLWKQDVSGRSRPWLECEVEAAGALRRAIAERVLVQLNTELRRSNEELDSFANAASHDLKEPLRGIHNFARFLQRSARGKLNAEEDGRIETIIRLSRRMDELTDALLDYSRVGRTAFPMEYVDLNKVVKQALDVLETRITETGTVISVPRPFPAVRSSRVPLANVFNNLITNALKYNDRPAGQQQIEIGWRDDTGGRVFYVRDNGIGIADEHLEHVFRIFRRLHGRDEYGGGTGAGLAISRHTMERLGGRLWAESGGLGLGTTFLLSLAGTPPEVVEL